MLPSFRSRPTLDQDGLLLWPALVMYPESKQQDAIEAFCEEDTFEAHLEAVRGGGIHYHLGKGLEMVMGLKMSPYLCRCLDLGRLPCHGTKEASTLTNPLSYIISAMQARL